MERFINFVFDVLLTAALKIIGFVLTMAILLQIFSRFVMINPFSWTEELSRFAFIWFCFLGASHALRLKLHLGIDYFVLKLAPGPRRVVEALIQAVVLFFGYLMLHFGIVMMGMTTFQKSPILRWPMSTMYMVLPVTGFFFVLFSGYRLVLILRGRDGGEMS